MAQPLVVGIDVGTSGVRALAMDGAGSVLGEARAAMAEFGADRRDAPTWWGAAASALHALLDLIDHSTVIGLCVDGTSGTLLAVDAAGTPLAPALMYDDPVPDAAILAAIADAAPPDSGAHGPTSGLAKLIALQSTPGVVRVIHQADWISGQLSGRFDVTDENNALKTGYDPVARRWPDWIDHTPAKRSLLPRVVPPGVTVGRIGSRAAKTFGLRPDTQVIAGTTDGCASFLATGAAEPGDAVTALGSTLTLKLLADRPLFAPQYGIYSHRLGDWWLAGGASNSGGAVLAHFFTADQVASLSAGLDPSRPSGLDYYPLLRPGERFPISDPHLAPRIEPRPADDARFLHGLLEGIAAIEALGYRRLAELGGPALRSVRSVGGGARNSAWAAIRSRNLGVPLRPAASEEAAAGAARLALRGTGLAGHQGAPYAERSR